MTDTKNTAKATDNGQGDDDKAAAQAAQQAEATGDPRRFDFDGHTYEILEGQPSPRALTYIARWTVDDENLAMILALREMLGEAQWELWGTRHRSERINDFWFEVNKAAGSGN